MAINKLVRDKVKALPGEVVRVLPLPVHRAMLVNKIYEEASEIARTPYDLQEYADVLACLIDTATLNGIAFRDVMEAEVNKRILKGGFLKGRFITARKK